MTQTADPAIETPNDTPNDTPADRESWLRRNQTWVKWLSVALIVVGVLLILRALPLKEGVEQLKGVIAAYGIWGYALFVLIYIAAAVLLIPGALLTAAAGAIFGVWQGFLTVIVGATLGACAGFLIARYLARSKVEKTAKDNKKFGAIDAAVNEGGWKIVGLLRLSPVIPYSLGNYLFGLTGVRLVPYALASFFCMMPGTLLYVYLGYVAAQAATGDGDAGVLKWVLTGVGLLATVAVTVYLTYLARKKLREQTDVEDAPAEETKGHPPVGWATYALPLLAVIVLAIVPFGGAINKAAAGLFGPPAADLTETYAGDKGTADFDHSGFDKVLKQYVDAEGFVDYPGLKADRGGLDAYVKSLADAPFDDLGRDAKLALLLDAYNAFTLQLILDHDPVKSIKDVDKPWDQKVYKLAGETVSLNEIEHERVRPNFKEPRVHFALVCAAFSCPKLRNEAYTADKLDAQLADQSTYSMTHPRWLQLDGGSLKLTSIMKWYGGDFDQTVGGPLKFAAAHNERVKKLVDAGDPPDVGFPRLRLVAQQPGQPQAARRLQVGWASAHHPT